MTSKPDHRRAFLKPLVLAGVVALLALLVVAGEGQPAYAATFTVTKTADTNDGTCDGSGSAPRTAERSGLSGGGYAALAGAVAAGAIAIAAAGWYARRRRLR